VLVTVVTAGVALAATGCGGTAAGTASPAPGGAVASAATTTVSAAPKFDVCAVMPADVLAAMGLPATGQRDSGGTCQWTATGRDVVAAEVGGWSLGHRPDPSGMQPTTTPLTIGGHHAVLFAAPDSGICGVDLALASDVTYDLWVTAFDTSTAPAACDHAKALATGAEPKLPLSS
jgi:hypothetical protein